MQCRLLETKKQKQEKKQEKKTTQTNKRFPAHSAFQWLSREALRVSTPEKKGTIW